MRAASLSSKLVRGRHRSPAGRRKFPPPAPVAAAVALGEIPRQIIRDRPHARNIAQVAPDNEPSLAKFTTEAEGRVPHKRYGLDPRFAAITNSCEPLQRQRGRS